MLPLMNLFQQVDMGLIANPSSRSALQSLWTPANQAYNAIGNVSRSFVAPGDVRPLQGVPTTKVQNMLNRIKLYPPFDSHQVGIFDVNISKLVTPQIAVNSSRVLTRANIVPNMTNDQLFDVSFNSGGQVSPITRQLIGVGPFNGSLLFTSYDEDVRLHHPPVFQNIPINPTDPQSTKLEATCFPVGGGTPFGWAYRIRIDATNTRLILCNAIHRLCALARAKYASCPLAVVDADASEIPQQFVELPRDMLLNPSQNPPLIVDYTNPAVVIQLDYYRMLKTVRLNWQFEQYATVLR